MFTSLLRLLAVGHKPRFADWPEPPDLLPVLDLANRSLGPLRFGSPLDDAPAFGRPDRQERTSHGTSVLLYAHLGVMLEFNDRHSLDYVTFLVAPDADDPKHPRLRHCAPRLSSGETFSRTTTEADLRKAFGMPSHEDRDEDEIVLYHLAHSLRIECELYPAGTLKRLNVYPTQSPSPPQ